MTERPTRALTGALVLTTSLFCSTMLAAQAAPLVVEVRAGASSPLASFATGSRAGEGTDAGASFALDLVLTGETRRALYVGFSQNRFGCGGAGCAGDAQYVATGFAVGFRWDLRTRGSVIPWVRLGGITTSVETPDGITLSADQAEGVSDLGYGAEMGLGVYIGTDRRVALNPGVRFSAINTGLPDGGLLRMRYLVADLAITLSF